jgi:hypothetical protein
MSKMRPPAVAEWQDWPGDAGHVTEPADATLSTEAVATASNLRILVGAGAGPFRGQGSVS